MNARLRVGVLIGAVLSLVVCAAVAGEWLLLGAPAGGWHYRYVQPFTLRTIVVALVVIGLAAALLSRPVPASPRDQWLLILAWVAVALGCQALLRALAPFSLEEVFVSEGANSFFTATQQHEALTVLRRFAAVQDHLPLHAQSNMPGKLMLLYALETITSRPTILAWLIMALSNAGASLMFAFVRRLSGDATVALYAAVLYLFMPSRIYFAPLMNTVTPVVVLGCAILLMRWLERGTLASAVLLGVGVYGLIFFEPLPLVVGLLFAALTFRAIRMRQLSWERLITQGAAGIVALIAFSELIHLLVGFELIDAFREVRAHAVAFNQTEGRPYGLWIRANLIEFLFGAGVCPSVLFFTALVDRLRQPGVWSNRLTDPIAVLTLGAACVLIVTDLIGLNRGEVIRLWVFLACFFQIPAAWVCARLGRTAIIVVVAASLLQAALGAAMIGFVVP